MLKIAHWVVSTGSLGLLLFEAPGGALLTPEPERGKVTVSQPGQGTGNPTVRGGPTFLWLGGGYQGGK
jgi:hypothetical protein